MIGNSQTKQASKQQKATCWPLYAIFRHKRLHPISSLLLLPSSSFHHATISRRPPPQTRAHHVETNGDYVTPSFVGFEFGVRFISGNSLLLAPDDRLDESFASVRRASDRRLTVQNSERTVASCGKTLSRIGVRSEQPMASYRCHTFCA